MKEGFGVLECIGRLCRRSKSRRRGRSLLRQASSSEGAKKDTGVVVGLLGAA